MLTFFPELYPDEWWYSVLCRYAVRSGLPMYKIKEELFGGNKRINAGLVPGNSCYKVISQLPRGTFDVENVLLNNTLLPYFMRMYPEEIKIANLELLKHGNHMEKTKFEVKGADGISGPQYCPICYKDDIDRYGEPYWHLEHQIPLMQVCIKHRCHLVRVPASSRVLAVDFIPLSSVKCSAPNLEYKPWELELSQVLFDLLRLPYLTGPTIGYSNLQLALAAKYRSEQVRQKPTFDSKKVKEACANFFSEDIVQFYFAKGPKGTYSIVSKWKCRSPERYALLCVLVGITVQQLFGPRLNFEDTKAKRLEELAMSGLPYTREEVSALLNVNLKSVKKLAELNNVEAVWTRRGNPGQRLECVSVAFSKDEMQKLCQAVRSNQKRVIAAYIRKLVLERVGQPTDIK